MRFNTQEITLSTSEHSPVGVCLVELFHTIEEIFLVDSLKGLDEILVIWIQVQRKPSKKNRMKDEMQW